MMNIFEFAMKMEQDGRTFYLEQARKQTSPQLEKLLKELADDELKHYEIFRAMKEGLAARYDESAKTTVMASVKNVFETIKAQADVPSFGTEAADAWKQAREVEKKSESFYREKASEATDEDQRHILNRIADEEYRHWVVLDNVIRFVEKPGQWIEDAEWRSMED